MIARIEAHAYGRFAGHFPDERHAIDGGQGWELGTEGEFFFATTVELKACSMGVLSGAYFEVPASSTSRNRAQDEADVWRLTGPFFAQIGNQRM